MQKDAPAKIKKVVIIGPECTGKSELSEYLADHFNTVWAREYAREYLDNLGRSYGPEDLLRIAQGQIALEDEMNRKAQKVLFCDTDLYVIKVWSYFKYGYCDKSILDSIRRRTYDLYLLTYIDIPWVNDPLREHPDQRETLYSLYLQEMQNQAVPFIEVKGSREARQKLAIDAVHKLLNDMQC
jgi:NadR type nicotinamide-nucleotide adenylyltransferase